MNQQANVFHLLEQIYPEITKIKSDIEEASINEETSINFDFAELTNDEINELINRYEQEAEGFPDEQE